MSSGSNAGPPEVSRPDSPPPAFDQDQDTMGGPITNAKPDKPVAPTTVKQFTSCLLYGFISVLLSMVTKVCLPRPAHHVEVAPVAAAPLCAARRCRPSVVWRVSECRRPGPGAPGAHHTRVSSVCRCRAALWRTSDITHVAGMSPTPGTVHGLRLPLPVLRFVAAAGLLPVHHLAHEGAPAAAQPCPASAAACTNRRPALHGRFRIRSRRRSLSTRPPPCRP